MLRIAGLVFIALGLLLGALLVLEPVGLVHVQTGVTASLLFLALTSAGHLMFAVASRLAAVHFVTRAVGSLLLLLACGAAVVLVLLVTGPESKSHALLQVGFVLVVSGLLGLFSLLGLRPVATS